MDPSSAAAILVVDDDRDMLALMAHALGTAGHETRLAMDAIEARKCMDREAFDLVICDILLPGLSGRSFGQQLAAEPNHPKLLFISAGDAIPGSLPGAFLKKPFKTDALVAVVAELLKRPR